ncbi:glycoside hydrolase family 3 N-terminal domain-containing protein [Niabella aurantiaca]|uniref:glycoside hydrolase family 3 N-terminal domain-containing protein n=1 Tax=Niabella aurantiaca TaxID=379900 RepID=UPI00036ECE6C|nr:glycoside hydrolase family 3 N-terminal domain-containing protein [Niabella aurantiaca]
MKYIVTAFAMLTASATLLAQKSIYHKDWIDFNKNGKKDIYEDPGAPLELRVKDLLAQMTVEEKTCQTATLYGYGRVLKDEQPTPAWKNEIWKDGIANIDEMLNGLAHNKKAQTKYSYPFSRHAEAINNVQRWFIEETRLGIPVDFTNEGIHGLNHDHATAFPAPISIGATWNKGLVRQMGQIVGREAKALGYTNVYAPILDVARDPRWGRVVETYGESPFLIAQLGTEMAAGIQENGVASTLKHFAVYSIPKGGRDGNARTDPHVAPREMHQLFLYPFKKVIAHAHPMGIMSSYNDWDGEPITASHYFLTELLRQQYGFNGYVVSDSRAVEFVSEKHHVAKDYKEAVKMVMEAGLNVRTEFDSPATFIRPLRELVKEGSVSVETLDQRVGEVLRVKFRLGLFDHPYVKDPKLANRTVATERSEAVALQMNRESLVLLKNGQQLLPLSTGEYKKILVTGPLADEKDHAISRYGPSNKEVISVLEGIRNYVGSQAAVQYVKGCEVADATWPESEIIETPLTNEETVEISRAVEAAKKSDVVIAVVGEDNKRVGESLSRTGLNLPGRQLKLLQELKKTGKPVVMVMINGQPLTINWENRYLDAILEAWFPGPQGGTAVAEALFGAYNPGGKLTMTFPKTTGQIELNFPFKPASHAGQPGDGPNGYGRTAVVGPLYPFGFGLSYTRFEYSNLQVSPEKGKTQSDIRVAVDIKNTGAVKGDEVVQLYVKDRVSSVTAYESVLRGFERVSLTPGATKTVHFKLTPDDLSLLDKHMDFVVEPGEFDIMVGSSLKDIRLKKRIELE